MLEIYIIIFGDVTYKQIVKQVDTMWLSLETATWNLGVYDGAKSYFLSSSESQARCQRLKVAFENLMSEFISCFTKQYYHTVHKFQ